VWRRPAKIRISFGRQMYRKLLMTARKMVIATTTATAPPSRDTAVPRSTPPTSMPVSITPSLP